MGETNVAESVDERVVNTTEQQFRRVRKSEGRRKGVAAAEGTW